MNTEAYDLAVHANRPADSSPSSLHLRQCWTAITTLIVAAVFAEAIFAGMMLSGVAWGRAAHWANAVALIASTLVAGLVSLVTLRRIPHGPRLGLTLLALAVVVLLQTAVGRSSVKGANLMWVHVPLGVALVGFAARAVAGARRLGGG
jgi:hypothetical protein